MDIVEISKNHYQTGFITSCHSKLCKFVYHIIMIIYLNNSLIAEIYGLHSWIQERQYQFWIMTDGMVLKSIDGDFWMDVVMLHSLWIKSWPYILYIIKRMTFPSDIFLRHCDWVGLKFFTQKTVQLNNLSLCSVIQNARNSSDSTQ